MSKKCVICGKSRTTGHSISKADNRSKRVFNPNIQQIRVTENGRTVRRNVCTSCIRSGKVTRAV